MNSTGMGLYVLGMSGGIFVIAAMVMYIFPPKKINSLYGYRTPASMKSEERWRFAQRFSAIAMLQSGIAMLLVAAIIFYLAFSEIVADIIAWTVFIIAIVFMFLRTERAIKSKYSES